MVLQQACSFKFMYQLRSGLTRGTDEIGNVGLGKVIHEIHLIAFYFALPFGPLVQKSE
jgi:hypothetical protein